MNFIKPLLNKLKNKLSNQFVRNIGWLGGSEPRRTLLTVAAAYFLWLLPQSTYKQIENIGVRITGASQKRRFLQ
jgi:hypothetical protein